MHHDRTSPWRRPAMTVSVVAVVVRHGTGARTETVRHGYWRVVHMTPAASDRSSAPRSVALLHGAAGGRGGLRGRRTPLQWQRSVSTPSVDTELPCTYIAWILS